jgi:hypothetical protein
VSLKPVDRDFRLWSNQVCVMSGSLRKLRGVERRRPRLRRLMWTQTLLPMRTKLVWHSRSQLCSDPASSPRFPIYLRPTSLAWGSLDTLPLPCSPFLKDLHDSSPCLPICSHCKQRRLPHSSPLRPHFPCQKAQTQRFPVANTANVRHSPRS